MEGRSALTGAPGHAAYTSEPDRSLTPNQDTHSSRPAGTENAWKGHRDTHAVSIQDR